MRQHAPALSESYDIGLDDATPWWHVDSATNQCHAKTMILLALLLDSYFKATQGLLQLLMLDDMWDRMQHGPVLNFWLVIQITS